MNGPQKTLIGQPCPRGNSKDAVSFFGPMQFIVLNVQPPAPRVGYGLGPVQVAPGFREAFARLFFDR